MPISVTLPSNPLTLILSFKPNGLSVKIVNPPKRLDKESLAAKAKSGGEVNEEKCEKMEGSTVAPIKNGGCI